MTKIYTPKQWRQYFRCASIIIDDDGRIFSADDYYKTFRSPIGKVDYSKNYIYGEDYSSTFATPIAQMVQNGDEIRVYEYGGGVFADPILYIKNKKIYTPDEYFRIFGGEASGYIEEDEKSGRGGGSGGRSGGSSGNVELPFPRLMMILGLALLIGIIYLLSDEGRIASASSIVAFAVNAFMLGRIALECGKGKMHFEWDKKRFLMGLLTGIGVYVLAAAILTALGIGSNIGTKGSPLSDAGADKMELSAMFIGLPFVINSLFVEQKNSKEKKVKTRKPAKDIFGVKNKSDIKIIATCPYCGQKCRVPADKGKIQVKCPNSNCNKKFFFNT